MSVGTPKIVVTVIIPITDALGTAGPAIDRMKFIEKIIMSAFKSTSTPYILMNIIAAAGI